MRAAVVPFPGGRGALDALVPSGRSLVLGLGLLVLAAAGVVAARTTSAFAVEHIRVEGATPALARQVRGVLERDRGSSLLGLDGGIVARVEALPDVVSASYDRAFPHTLVVRVVRERPAAVLRRGSGSWLLSERGRVLRPVARGAFRRLPRIWSADGAPPAAGDLLTLRGVAAPMRAVRAVPPDFPAQVRSVALERGLVLAVLAGGLELRLGEPRDLPLKLAAAAAVLPQLEPRALGGPDYVDVSLPERPVAGTLNSEVEADG
ncbi:MAG TPA: cell division protein FtsQ/DivIB [Gaiellaceae bacterium]|nr:cell division protein FtsQ/DivIB [Gaiellaceae bacterium]